MVTRNGIYYDFTKSKYRYKITDTEITLVFSSDLHMIKFEEQYLQHRKEHNIKFSSRFRINILITVLPDLILYKRIETRGFLIINERGQKLCQENLLLIGERATPKE